MFRTVYHNLNLFVLKNRPWVLFVYGLFSPLKRLSPICLVSKQAAQGHASYRSSEEQLIVESEGDRSVQKAVYERF